MPSFQVHMTPLSSFSTNTCHLDWWKLPLSLILIKICPAGPEDMGKEGDECFLTEMVSPFFLKELVIKFFLKKPALGPNILINYGSVLSLLFLGKVVEKVVATPSSPGWHGLCRPISVRLLAAGEDWFGSPWIYVRNVIRGEQLSWTFWQHSVPETMVSCWIALLGVGGTVLQQFWSFLSVHTQKVVGGSSAWYHLFGLWHPQYLDM